MPIIQFHTEPFTINGRTILLLPANASSKLPSRGMVMVKGTINGRDFQTPLEPDGRGSHWFAVEDLDALVRVRPSDTAELEIEPAAEWPEPQLPADVRSALAANSEVHKLWQDITPMARWDWLRWIASTGRDETRKRRIEVAISKLSNGTRRPCCFNRTACTDMTVSKNGALLVPATA